VRVCLVWFDAAQRTLADGRCSASTSALPLTLELIWINGDAAWGASGAGLACCGGEAGQPGLDCPEAMHADHPLHLLEARRLVLLVSQPPEVRDARKNRSI
jgi:hypothetical protein